MIEYFTIEGYFPLYKKENNKLFECWVICGKVGWNSPLVICGKVGWNSPPVFDETIRNTNRMIYTTREEYINNTKGIPYSTEVKSFLAKEILYEKILNYIE